MDRALAIFKTNRALHPGDKFWPYVGLASGFTAVGDKKSAITCWEVALKNVPPDQQPNLPSLERLLAGLRATP